MATLFDTHCHLHLLPHPEREEVFLRAREAGVRFLMNVSCSLKEQADCVALAEKYADVWTTAGLHPTELGGDMEKDLAAVRKAAKHPRVMAIGEIGLDTFHDHFPHDVQEAYLRGQLTIARELKKPAILHCRSGKNAGENDAAYDNLLRILKDFKDVPCVSHCFSGSPRHAEALLAHGAMISFTGILTYPRNTELREIAKATPLERILLETDSPFLPPEKYRGQRNEPAYLLETARTLAEVKGLLLDDVATATTGNAFRFFGIERA